MPAHAALLAASAAAHWPLQGEALGAILAGAGGCAPLAAGLHSMLLPDASAVQAAVQAAAAQHQLAMLQVGAAPGRAPACLHAAASCWPVTAVAWPGASVQQPYSACLSC